MGIHHFLANQKKLFLAFKCQKYIRGMLGRIKAKVWISKWRYDCPTPLLFSTPERAIFNYEFSNQMYQLQQRVRVLVFCLWSTCILVLFYFYALFHAWHVLTLLLLDYCYIRRHTKSVSWIQGSLCSQEKKFSGTLGQKCCYQDEVSCQQKTSKF